MWGCVYIRVILTPSLLLTPLSQKRGWLYFYREDPIRGPSSGEWPAETSGIVMRLDGQGVVRMAGVVVLKSPWGKQHNSFSLWHGCMNSHKFGYLDISEKWRPHVQNTRKATLRGHSGAGEQRLSPSGPGAAAC